MAPTCIYFYFFIKTHPSLLHFSHFFNFSSHILSYILSYSLLLSLFFSIMTSPYIHTRDGYVVFSASKPPMKMKFWHIFTMIRLKKELMRWLEGEIEVGDEIRRIQRKRTTMNFATGQPRIWLEEVKTDVDVIAMMYGSDEIVLTVVVS